MKPLQNPDALTNSEVLPQFTCLDLHCDWHLLKSLERDNLLLVDRDDGASAPLELALDDFTSITILDLQLSVITDSLENSLISHEVPFVLVTSIAAILIKQSRIQLEPPHLIQHRTHVLMLQLTQREPHEQVAISEHQVSPHIGVLAKEP